MPEGLGGLVFKGVEDVVEHNSFSKSIIDNAEHFFSLDSKLTGKSGGAIKNMLRQYEDESERLLNKEVSKLPPNYKQLPKTNLPDPATLRANASSQARANVFGSKHQNLAFALEAMKREHGPYGEQKVKEITDHLGVYFHDKTYEVKPGQYTSTLPKDLAKYKGLQGINFKPSPYVEVNPTEKFAKGSSSNVFAYKAAIPHSTQSFVNSLFNARASSLVKAMGDIFGSGYSGAKAQLITSNAIGSELFREYSEFYNYKDGVLDKYTPGSVGEFINRNYHIPGMTAVRHFGTVVSGLVGKYEARQAAWGLVNNHERRSSVALSELGLDWKDIQSRGGVLTKEEEEKAMRYMINRNMFRDQAASRTKFASATPLGRVITLYHGFVTNQQRTIVDALMRSFKTRDIPMLMQQLATLGIIAPTAGAAIYSIDQAITGQNKHPIDNFLTREKAIYRAHDFAEAVTAVSHMGGFGIANNVLNAAARQKLTNYMVGAPINAASELVQDAVVGNKTSDENHPHAWDQFKRDILHDLPTMGVGSYIAHKAYPTRAERQASRPQTIRSIRAKNAAAKRRRKYAAE